MSGSREEMKKLLIAITLLTVAGTVTAQSANPPVAPSAAVVSVAPTASKTANPVVLSTPGENKIFTCQINEEVLHKEVCLPTSVRYQCDAADGRCTAEQLIRTYVLGREPVIKERGYVLYHNGTTRFVYIVYQ